jgi:hypothetical protein
VRAAASLVGGTGTPTPPSSPWSTFVAGGWGFGSSCCKGPSGYRPHCTSLLNQRHGRAKVGTVIANVAPAFVGVALLVVVAVLLFVAVTLGAATLA